MQIKRPIITKLSISAAYTSPVQLVAENRGRTELIVRNRGAGVLWIGTDQTAAAAQRGIDVPANGTLTLTACEAPLLAWASGGTAEVSLVETMA